MSTQPFTHYYIVDNITACTTLVQNLREAGITEEDIGVLSKDEEFSRADVPEVDLTDKSNVLDALQRGAFIGSGGGLLVGLALAFFPVTGVAFGGAAIASMVAGGAAAGAWSASMIGISEQSPLVERFDQALMSGQTIILYTLRETETEHTSQAELVEQVGGVLDFGELT